MAQENLQQGDTVLEAASMHELKWLAETHRNHDFVTQPPPTPFGHADDADPVPFSAPLDYEPRSIATNSLGTLAAIGTKSGKIHLAEWNDTRRAWEEEPLDINQGDDTSHPIRALSFIGARLLAAGRGCGEFILVDITTRRRLGIQMAPSSSGSRHGWLDRFVDIISLVRPVSIHDGEAHLEPGVVDGGPRARFGDLGNGPIALGLTNGRQLHILSFDNGRFISSAATPENLGISGVRWAATRIVGGAWAHDRLWLLDSGGRVLRLLPNPNDQGGKDGGSVAPLEGHQRIHFGVEESATDPGHTLLTPVREAAEFKEIRACMLGLAIRASDEIAVLRFRADSETSRPRLVLPQRWHTARDAIDFTIGVPFFRGRARDFIEWDAAAKPPRYRQRLTKRYRLWLVLATTRPGLRWIPCHEGPDGSVEPREGVVSARPGLRSSTLYVRMGWRGTGNPFVVYALRDHEFRIAPLIEKTRTEARINELIERLSLHSRPPQEWNTPGIAWWSLRHQISSSMSRLDSNRPSSIAPGASLAEELLTSMDAADLRSLLDAALRAWQDALQANTQLPDAWVAPASSLRRWLFRILTRAHELEDKTLISSLARTAVDFLSRPSSTAGHSDAKQDIDLLTGFLRKWLVFGYTYANKQVRLQSLQALNMESGHHLDALAYGTLLLKQRADVAWQTNVGAAGSTPTHWALAMGQDGAFSIHSDTQGTLHALSASGVTLSWRLAPKARRDFQRHFLELPPPGEASLAAIRHVGSPPAHGEYKQRPYARRLLLIPLAGAEQISVGSKRDLHLLVFSFKGSRRDQANAVGGATARPRLLALLIRPDRHGESIELLDLASVEIPGDVYALCHVPGTEPGPFIKFLAGTNGVWNDAGRSPSIPFVEMTVALGQDGIEGLTRSDASVTSVEDCGTPTFATDWETRTRHNPCWSLGIQRDDDDTWVWAGFHDGHIRRYLYVKESDEWLEGAGPVASERDAPVVPRARHPSFRATAAVWSLLVLPTPASGSAPGGRSPVRLAYGTADGVIGALALEAPPDTPRAGTTKAPERAEHFVHLIHSREDAPICGLVGFEDEGTTKLLAVTQDGVTVVFDVGSRPRSSRDRAFTYSGLRLDRFRLGHSARAVGYCDVNSGPGSSGTAHPAIVVGTSEGSVYKRPLVSCRGSRAHRALKKKCLELLECSISGDASLTTPPEQRPVASVIDCVGEELPREWIRILDVGGDHLMSFCIWQALKEATRHCLRLVDADPSRLDEECSKVIALFSKIGEQVFRRRPFCREPMKAFWDEGARLANALCHRALNPSALDRRALLHWHMTIIDTLDNQCNRWIGHEPAIESKVLMHVFDAIFDWTDIALIVLPDAPDELVDIDRRHRRFIIQNLLQRRLNHADPLVSLEALHTVNRSMLRAIVHVPPTRATLRLPRTAAQDEPALGLFDIMTMVGKLPARLDAGLAPSRPLSTEVVRFFALCIMLVPDSSRLVQKVVSENHLANHLELILTHFQAMRRQAVHELGMTAAADARWDAAMEAIVPPAAPKSRSPTPLQAADGSLCNTDFFIEQNAVTNAVQFLTELSPKQTPHRQGETPSDAWLDTKEELIHYFQHSYRFLNWLRKQRVELQGKLEERQVNDVLAECEKLTELLDHVDLHEPHRGEYRKMFVSWEGSARQSAQDAVEMLRLVEGFNRHVYRASADELRAATTELAMQVAPMFPWVGPNTLRPDDLRELLGDHRLIRKIYDEGQRLAENTQLIETLIAVASARPSRKPGELPIGPVALSNVDEVLRNIAKQAGLELQALSPRKAISRDLVPGTIAIWQAILHEWIKNVLQHGSAPDESDQRTPTAHAPAGAQPSRRGYLYYVLHPIGDGWLLRLAGNKSFYNSLAPKRPKEDSDGKLLSDLDRLASKLGSSRPSQRENGNHQAGGYGIFMIFGLCKLMGFGHRAWLDVPHPEHTGASSSSSIVTQANTDERLKADPKGLVLWLELTFDTVKGATVNAR